MTEPIPITGLVDINPMGHAIITRQPDGTRTVEHADPTIRVSLEHLNSDLDLDFIELDGTLRLDTAGTYRYTGTPVDGWRHYVLIGGADDNQVPGYEPHP